MKNTNNQNVREISDDELLKSFLTDLEEIRETEPERYKKNLLRLAGILESNDNEDMAVLCRIAVSMNDMHCKLKGVFKINELQ